MPNNPLWFWEHGWPLKGVWMLGVIASIRNLTDDEIKFTVAVAAGIAELSKGSQRHVVAALAKIFS